MMNLEELHSSQGRMLFYAECSCEGLRPGSNREPASSGAHRKNQCSFRCFIPEKINVVSLSEAKTSLAFSRLSCLSALCLFVSASPQRLPQIVDQVLRIFQSNRKPHRSWFDARRMQFIRAHAEMRSINRKAYQRFDSAQARRQQKDADAVAKTPRPAQSVLDIE